MINPFKAGLAMGGFFAATHIVWSIVLALHWGQAWFDFWVNLHSVNSFATIDAFDLTRSVELVIVAAFVGFVLGNVFAHIWNWVRK